MRNATELKMLKKTPTAFVLEQVVVTLPVLVPLWVAGLVHFFRAPEGRPFQVLAWIWLSVFFLLMATGAVRANYLGPAYAPLLAAGGVAFERLARRARWRWVPATAAVAAVIGGLVVAPFALPLLPPARFVAYQGAIGLSAPVDQRDELGVMPLHYALRFGWDELLDALDAAHATLTPAEREKAVVFGSWFGDTGAVNALGPARGLPPAISGHNNYWLWGPGDATGEVLLVVAESDEELAARFASVERVAEIDCRYCMPGVARLAIFVCRGLRRPIAEAWPDVKNYI